MEERRGNYLEAVLSASVTNCRLDVGQPERRAIGVRISQGYISGNGLG